MTSPAVRTVGLTKNYGDTVGIDGLDLVVEPGEVFGFLGPNGAGKTTTIRILLDLIRPTSGQARVFGLDCHEDGQAVRRRVGYLPGELALWEDLTGRQTVEHLARVRNEEVDPVYVESLADRLSAPMDTPAGELSTGNKQKIGLVQALMARPDLAILDEPTRGLDPLMQREVLALVDEARGEDRTVFFSSHVLHEVERVCDRVAIVRQGELVAVEDVEDLIQEGARQIDVLFANPVPEHLFDELEGLRSAEVDGRRARLVHEGPVDPLVKALSRHEVVDLRSRDPSLEEVFLSYYEGSSEGSRGS